MKTEPFDVVIVGGGNAGIGVTGPVLVTWGIMLAEML